MKVRLVRIGNSKGIRIPSAIIEHCGLGDTVELEIRDRTVVISPGAPRRAGWSEAFAATGERGRDDPLWEVPESDWDRREWQW